MSKHRSRSRNNDVQNNNFMGLNPQILQMLGLNNDDIQKINGIMNSMNTDGFDINSIGNILNPNGQNNNLGNNNNNSLNNSNQQNTSNNQGNFNNNENMNNMDLSYLLSMLNNMNNNMPNYNGNSYNNYTNNQNNSSNNYESKNYNNDNEENIQYGDIDVEIIEPELDSDPNLSMLKAVRSLVNDDRKRFLKRVIEMYKNGEIVY